MRDDEIVKANDILDKFDFFEGQRAGRELWFNKPFDVQNEDIEDFSKDIAFLRGFIADQKAEIERLKGKLIIERTRRENAVKACHEARKEFAERLENRYSYSLFEKGGHPSSDRAILVSDLRKLLAEMEERE